MNNKLTYHVRSDEYSKFDDYSMYFFFFFREPHTYMRDDDMNMNIDATRFTQSQRTAR
jgi:hypothetical protein